MATTADRSLLKLLPLMLYYHSLDEFSLWSAMESQRQDRNEADAFLSFFLSFFSNCAESIYVENELTGMARVCVCVCLKKRVGEGDS